MSKDMVKCFTAVISEDSVSMIEASCCESDIDSGWSYWGDSQHGYDASTKDLAFKALSDRCREIIVGLSEGVIRISGEMTCDG